MKINDKPLLALQAPISSRSGYGDKSRDILKSIIELDKYDIKIIPTAWGSTPQNQINPETEFGKFILENIITKLDKKPDVFVQVTVANEANPIGKFNILCTSVVETTMAPREFIEGSNRMDLVITPSEFTKDVLSQTGYNQVDKQTQKTVGVIKLTTPVVVLFEGVNTDIFQEIEWID